MRLTSDLTAFAKRMPVGAVGLPVEGIGVLHGVDTVSDMLRAMANVTGWLAVGTIPGKRGEISVRRP